MSGSSSAPSPPREVVLDASAWVTRQIPGNANQAPATAWVNGHLQAGGYFVEPAWLRAEHWTRAAAIANVIRP